MPTFADSICDSSSCVLLDEGGEPTEEARAIRRRHGAPAGERDLRGGDGGVGLLDSGLRDLGYRLLSGGIDDGERHPRSKRRSRS